MILLLLGAYGVPIDGFPSHVERELVLWTNAARVAPEEFEDSYNNAYEPCSYYENFSEDEQDPKAPLYIDLDLTEVARVHSIDMHDNGCFQHESCDGTDTFERIGRYYDDTTNVGENIAYGSSDPYYMVMQMWMCSDAGHRANIMSGGFNEMGGGVKSDFMTQDFAGGSLEEGEPPVRVAVDIDDTWWADWGDSDAPAIFDVVIAGKARAMELRHGDEANGIYAVEFDDIADDTPWFVRWETDDGARGTFPEEGSWISGAASDDWEEGQDSLGGALDGLTDREKQQALLADVRLTGCASVPGGSGIGGIAGLLLFLARRRR